MEQGCVQCPRKCGAVRSQSVGFCGASDEIRLARAALHLWEEPCISGKNGSGTLFFVGCNLRCIYCQNRRISRGEGRGVAVSPRELECILLRLQSEGAANINLVTPTPYARQLIPVLKRVREKLRIPIVYNCGGYESVETLCALEGLIDIYLPDCKYHASELSKAYSAASDYFSVAMAALDEMLRQVGAPVMDEDGLMRKGVIVRHLVLPGCREDSIRLLRMLYKRYGNKAFLLSLMSQYTPDFADTDAPKVLHRKVTSFEYQKVLEAVEQLGFEGYLQKRTSSAMGYTPDFGDEDEKTVLIKNKN